jgi:hypothetical protein
MYGRAQMPLVIYMETNKQLCKKIILNKHIKFFQNKGYILYQRKNPMYHYYSFLFSFLREAFIC